MPDPEAQRHGIQFTAKVSLGNALIILSMLATGAVGIYEIATGMSDLRHSIELESTLRLESEKNLAEKIAEAAKQEQKDLGAISETLKELREDYRELVKASAPPVKKR